MALNGGSWKKWDYPPLLPLSGMQVLRFVFMSSGRQNVSFKMNVSGLSYSTLETNDEQLAQVLAETELLIFSSLMGNTEADIMEAGRILSHRTL